MEGKNQTEETTEIDHTDQEPLNMYETVTMTATTSATAVVGDDETIAEIGTEVEVMDAETIDGETTEVDMARGIWTEMVTGDNTEMIEVPERMTEINAIEEETEKESQNAVAEARVENALGRENQLQMLRTQI
jgi:hypothetical protein